MNAENIKYCFSVLGRICENSIIKSTASTGLIVMNFLFDASQKKSIIALIVLVAMDFVTALYASYKNHEHIQSHKALRTAIKLAIYFLIISAGYIAEEPMHVDILDDIIIGFLASTELISILENMAKSGYAVPKALLNRLKKFNKSK